MEATQESTQPYADPRRIGINNSGLHEQDLADIICILHPNSMAAHEAVAATARLYPQHILQRQELEDDAVDTTALDIALRLSSDVHDASMGFSFGRNRERCDIILAPDDSAKRVSNVHFRISLTDDGIVMLDDTSTNGTVVDNCRLRRNQNPSSQMLQSGSVITVVTGTREGEAVKFVVREPSREGYGRQYSENLYRYLQRIKKTKDSAHQVKMQETPSKGVLQWTVGNLYGMHWTGGSLYNVTGQIGKGAFATVYKLATKQHGTVYAGKELDKRRFMKNGILDQKVDNEMKIMRDLKHPNIVQYVDYHEHDRWVYIIMEYVGGGELSTYLQNNGKIPEEMVKNIARQVLHALQYLHKRKITHRDIKPDNILIASFDPLRVKLSDFGLSKVVQEESFLKTFCGTLLYCAPEVYPEYEHYRKGEARKRRRLADPPPKTSPYDQSVDMWSLGAVLFHLLCGSPPYMGRGDDRGAQMLRNIMTTEADYDLLRREGVSEDGIDFVSKLLQRDPHARAKERECFKHPWLVNVPDIDVYSDDEMSPEENGNLTMIVEAAEEDLDASQLSLHEKIEAPKSSDPESSNDNFSKRPRLEDVPIQYPALPNLESFPNGNDKAENGNGPQQAGANRLFGEISASDVQESRILGDLDVEMLPVDDDSSFSSFGLSATGESRGPRLDPSGYSPLLSFNLGGSAPSLLGAEALVDQLNMSSSDVPPPSTRSSHAPVVTPPKPGKEESTSVKEGLSEANSNPFDVTPKARVPYRRRIEMPLPDTASESSRDPEAQTSEDDGGNEVFPQRIVVDMVGDGSEDEETPRLPATTLGDTNYDFATGTNPNFPSVLRTLDESPFVKPRPLLGKLTSLPGSIFDLSIRLEERMTSWGRGPHATVCYPEPMDTRIPAYALEVTFWKPGPEFQALVDRGEDWTKIPDVMAILSTKTRRCIWVNGVELRRGPEPEEWEGFYFGKLYTGDVITVYQHRDRYLKFRCEFYFGESAGSRPDDEAGFQVKSVVKKKRKSKTKEVDKVNGDKKENALGVQ